MTLAMLRTTLLAACLIAAPAYAQQPTPPAEAAAPAATQPPAAGEPNPEPAAPLAGESTGPISPPPPGKGAIVFFRTSVVGALVGCTVHEDDKVVTKLSVGKYFVSIADPGVHTFLAQSEAKDRLRIEVEAGETYFVKCAISMGIMVGRPNLLPSDRATFEQSAKSLKLQAPPA